MLISHLSPYAIFTPEEYPAIHGKLVEYLEEIREEYLHGTSYSEVDIYSKFLKMLVLIGQNFTPPNIKEID